MDFDFLKTNFLQVDENGLPTASGLVRLYTEGVTDRNYFLATVQAVHQCLTLAGNRRSYNPEALQGTILMFNISLGHKQISKSIGKV